MVTKTTKNASAGLVRAKKIPTIKRKSTTGVKRKVKAKINAEAEIVKDDKEFLKDNIQNNKATTQIFILVFVVLIILLSGFFVYKYFIKPNNYLIQNKYYGFKFQAPKGWIAEENTAYSESNINEILTECKKDKLGSGSEYEIGAFRIENKKVIVLELTIKCIPHTAGDYSSSVIIGGEKAVEEIVNYPEIGSVKQISFWHNNFQYQIKEYLHASIKDTNMFNKIISSFVFVK